MVLGSSHKELVISVKKLYVSGSVSVLKDDDIGSNWE